MKIRYGRGPNGGSRKVWIDGRKVNFGARLRDGVKEVHPFRSYTWEGHKKRVTEMLTIKVRRGVCHIIDLRMVDDQERTLKDFLQKFGDQSLLPQPTHPRQSS